MEAPLKVFQGQPKFPPPNYFLLAATGIVAVARGHRRRRRTAAAGKPYNRTTAFQTAGILIFHLDHSRQS